MKKTFLISAAGVILSLAGCGRSTQPAAFTQISSSEAVKMMDETDDYKIVDVRTVSEYNSGHIPNAICIPNESIDENVTAILTDKEQTLLVYCRSGNRSKQASQKLAELGYTNIYEFGGVNTWEGELVK